MELLFSSFVTDHNLNYTKISNGHVTKKKKPRDYGLLSEPTTEVNGIYPQCKRVTSNLVRIKEVTIRATFSHMINIVGIIYYTCSLVIDLQLACYKNAFNKRFYRIVCQSSGKINSEKI